MDVPTRVSVMVAQEEPWVGRSFLKDAKLRASERYWRPALLPPSASAGTEHERKGARICLEAVSSSAISSTATLLLPDALTWRKYLRLIRRIVDLCSAAAVATVSKEAAADPFFQWILTESATELLDHRNQSLREAAAPQERSLLQRLVLEQSSHNNNNNSLVVALADLSVRENANGENGGSGGDDEWDLLEYPSLNLTERSRQALVRAGNLLNGASSLLRRNNSSSSSSSSSSDSGAQLCWLVVDDDNARLPLDEDDTESANMKYVSMDQIIDAVTEALKLSIEEAERLRQLKQVCKEEYERRNAPAADTMQEAIETVLTEEEIRKRLQTGQLLRGRLNVTRDNVREAFVTTSGGKQTFFVQFDHFNRAFHQDMVLIEPLPESQWGRPVGKRRLVHQSDNNDENDTDAATLDHHLATTPTVPSARVVAIDQPTRRVFVATMTDVPHNDGAVLVIPMDPRIPKIRIRTRSWQRFVGVRLKVEIVDWDADSNYPTGHCVKILGPIGDLETEIGALLIENLVELDPFSTEALACLPVEGSDWRVTEDQVQQRKDLRTSRRVFSVDPPGCQDIDDTMHAEVLPNGDVEGKKSDKEVTRHLPFCWCNF